MAEKDKDISTYLKAGYPCIFLPTVEPEVAEARVRKAMEETGKMDDVTFGTWRVTTGLMMDNGSGGQEKVHSDLLDALAYIEKTEDPVLIIFHNVRQFVTNYQVIQQMVDSIMAARLKWSHLVFVGPHLELPLELKNLVTYVDCPLPSREQIKGEYEKLTRAYETEITLPKDKEERESLLIDASTAAVGLDMIGAENALALSLALSNEIDVRVIQGQKEQEVRKSDVLEFISVNETMDQVGGFHALKTWFTKRRRAFTEEARDYGLPYPKGVLLVGPAGTGKSLAAKAIASYLRLPLLRLDMGKVFRSLVGESEASIRMALQVAEAVAPVVLWLDEVDKGLAGMKGSGELDSGVTARVISTILTWRQETTAPVMLAATANDVTAIPSMVYRKGRLDEVWSTDLPTVSEREEIFNIHLLKRKREPAKFEVSLLAKRTDKCTGSEIEAFIEDGMFTAFDERKEVETAHILKAIKETTPQAVRDAEEIAETREWCSTRARSVSGEEDQPKKKSTIRTITPKKKGVSK